MTPRVDELRVAMEAKRMSEMMKSAPWPYFGEEEIQAATAVLRSGKVNYWTGEEGRLFEKEFAAYVGSDYAVAVANGTVALELALHGMGIGKGDAVITTSRTFLATASSIAAVGARPVFADVDRDSQNITAESIRAALEPEAKAVIVVHLAGWPCEMDAILALAREHGLFVIEDCAQAHGSMYRGKMVGSLGDVGAFSFCQDKNMTTAGEGGMVTTNSEALWRRMWSYKDHGKNYDAVYNRQHPWGFRWLHESLGTNWRLTEVQSAVGRVALRKLLGWIEKRRTLAAIYADRLAHIAALRVPLPAEHLHHSHYRFYAFVHPELLAQGWNRDRIAQCIQAAGVPCTVGSCSEIYLEKCIPEEWRPEESSPVARELGETSLMFLAHPTLNEADVERACNVVEEVMREATQTVLTQDTDVFADSSTSHGKL